MYDPSLKTLFIGKKIVYLPTCHSTNDIAAELVRNENLPEGAVVITDDQTAGRGQRGARWITPPGQNFTFSLILRPTFLAASEQFLLSQTVAIGLQDFISSFTENAQIKWPNDLYVNGLKVGGVLIETAWQGARMAHAIVGIGLNINQIVFGGGSGDKEPTLRATSLRLETGMDYDLNLLLPHLLQMIERAYLRLRAGQYAHIKDEYQRAMLGYGESRLFQADGQVFEGVVAGVTALGRLRVHKSDGLQREFDIKEIKWL